MSCEFSEEWIRKTAEKCGMTVEAVIHGINVTAGLRKALTDSYSAGEIRCFAGCGRKTTERDSFMAATVDYRDAPTIVFPLCPACESDGELRTRARVEAETRAFEPQPEAAGVFVGRKT